MFSVAEKQWLAAEFEKLILSLKHPEMPTEKPSFTIHIDGKESWSWADIKPNWTFGNDTSQFSHANPWNEISRFVLDATAADEKREGR